MEDKKIEQGNVQGSNINTMIENTIASTMKNKSEEEQSKLKELLTKIYVEGETPREAMGLTDAMVNSLYKRAYKYYESGKYPDAEDIFNLLHALDEGDIKFIMGLAACHHMQKKYKEAVSIYLIANVLDLESPIPFYQMADCYIQLNQKFNALVALEIACLRAEKNPIYEPIRGRARMVINSLNEQLFKEVNQKNRLLA